MTATLLTREHKVKNQHHCSESCLEGPALTKTTRIKKESLYSRLNERYSQLPRWVAPAVAGAVALGVCFLLALRDPREESSYSTGCPFLAVTGVLCPGCGVSRTINRLMWGDVAGALRYNILAVAVVPVMIYSWLRWILPEKTVENWWAMNKMTPTQIKVLWTVVFAFFAFRNLPFDAFSWLAPENTPNRWQG